MTILLVFWRFLSHNESNSPKQNCLGISFRSLKRKKTPQNCRSQAQAPAVLLSSLEPRRILGSF